MSEKEDEKIQIKASETMDAAMGAMKTSNALLSSFDWEHLLKAMEFGEGVGAVINPGVAQQIYADKEWEHKKRLVRAAQHFVSEFQAVGKALGVI